MKKLFLRENCKGDISKYKTEVKLDVVDNKLKCQVKAYDSNFYTPYKNFNDPIYEGCCVEIFIQEQKNKYLEIEIAPNGVQFVAIIYVDENTGARTLEFKDEMVVATVLQENRNYEVIFFVDLKKYFTKINELKLNVYRIECDGKNEQYLMALNPTLSNTFHCQNAFVDIGEIS